ncbi:Wiskott-Aldrich syndrome protein [Halotydeus destructor]|nr:Wiskott-Aldrich syndrome protein [Halotydeus destructor]
MTSFGAVNQKSDLLTDEDNELVFQLLGNQCYALATAVVDLHVQWISKPSYSTWDKMATGVACFVRDTVSRSYFIRVFDLLDRYQTWELDASKIRIYSSDKPHVHRIQGDDKMAALSFKSSVEAEAFKTSVTKRLNLENFTTCNSSHDAKMSSKFYSADSVSKWDRIKRRSEFFCQLDENGAKGSIRPSAHNRIGSTTQRRRSHSNPLSPVPPRPPPTHPNRSEPNVVMTAPPSPPISVHHRSCPSREAPPAPSNAAALVAPPIGDLQNGRPLPKPRLSILRQKMTIEV